MKMKTIMLMLELLEAAKVEIIVEQDQILEAAMKTILEILVNFKKEIIINLF